MSHRLNGILNIDKPRGMTSHDVVDGVRRLVRMRAIGHTGTLDPAASGVLLLCLGRATKYACLFEALEKTYWAVMQLGVCTDTQDATGRVVSQQTVPPLSTEGLQEVLIRFRGGVRQTPPMYSAVKYRGQRLYRLARQGQTVVRPAREVFIRRLELIDLRGQWVTLGITCSKGTYIRTLCEDIGLALGCGGHLVHLQRCRIGEFRLARAYTLDDLRHQQTQARSLEQLLIPVPEALAFLPALSLTSTQYTDLQRRQDKTLPAILGAFCLSPHISSYRLCVVSKGTVAVLQRQTTASERWRVRYLEETA